MNNGSSAYEEYVFRRCDEIITNSKEYNELCGNILKLEADFLKTLTKEQIKEYNKMEEMIMQSIAHITACAYKVGAEDALKCSIKS
jgi:uncharacterized protein YpbB